MDIETAAHDVWAAFLSGSRDEIYRVLTDDVEWIAPEKNATAVALDTTNHMIGKTAIADLILNELPKLFCNGMEIEQISVTADENRVVFEQLQRAVLVNGREYENVYVFIFEFERHKVRRIREYMDTQKGCRMIFGDDPHVPIVGRARFD